MGRARLRRLEFVFPSAPIYFITACTHYRRKLLNCDVVHEAFLAFLRQAARRGIFVGRYVLMPDHLHLFAAFAPRAGSLSAWIKSLKNFLSMKLRELETPGPHWQKGFFDHVMRSRESYAEQWQYVTNNPVRAGLVARAEAWPFQEEVHPMMFPQG